MSGQTVVEYGEIKIFHCQTLVFTQEAVSEDNDYLYSKYTIRVVGFIHGKESDYGETVRVEPFLGDNAADQYNGIKHRMMEPRQRLIYMVGADENGNGGKQLVRAFPFRQGGVPVRGNLDDKDVQSGPRCKTIELTQVTGTHIFRGEFEFEACILDCPQVAAVKILSNKWSLIDSVDGNRWTTRTTTGRLKLADANVSPHDFRHLAVPPLGQGMRRELLEFNSSLDGLELDYRIVDKEAPGGQPPRPATSWAYRHTNASADPVDKNASGYMLSSEFEITLCGDRNADKQQLIAIAASMAEAKVLVPIQQEGVNFRDERRLAAAFIESMSITDEVDDVSSRVTLWVRVLRTATIRSFNAVSSLAFGVPMDKLVAGTGVIGNDYDIRDSRGNWPGQKFTETEGPVTVTGAFVTFLQSGCDGARDIKDGVRTEGTAAAQKGKPTIKAFVSDQRPENSPEYMSASHSRAIYIGFSMEHTYAMDEMKVPMPVARFSSGQSPTSGFQDTVANVVLGPAVASRNTRMFGMRIGFEPEFPTLQSFFDSQTGITFTLLKSKIRKGEPKRTPDGKEIHRAWQESEWSLSRPPRPDESLLVGVNPMESVGLRRTQKQLTNSQYLNEGPTVA